MELDESKYYFLKTVLTFEEGCKYSGLSKSKMYKFTRDKEVPFYKPRGKKIYFRRQELDAWLLRNRIKPIDEVEREALKMAL